MTPADYLAWRELIVGACPWIVGSSFALLALALLVNLGLIGVNTWCYFRLKRGAAEIHRLADGVRENLAVAEKMRATWVRRGAP